MPDTAPGCGCCEQFWVIITLLRGLNTKLERLAMTEQADVDQVAAEVQAEDTDVVALTAKVTAGQAALDQVIAALEAQVAAGQAPDLTQLKAVASVLAGDQPNLDAAVAALAADPAVPPAA